MVYSHRYFFPCQRNFQLTPELKQTLINKMIELQKDFFQQHKKGDSDRWHPDTPRLNQCERFEFVRVKDGFDLIGVLESEIRLYAFRKRKTTSNLMFNRMEFMHFWWAQHRLDNPERNGILILA